MPEKLTVCRECSARAGLPVFGCAQGMAVSTDSHSDEHRSNERTEVSSDTTEGESKVHALREEGVDPTGDPASQVSLQHTQELIHLHIETGAEHITYTNCDAVHL